MFKLFKDNDTNTKINYKFINIYIFNKKFYDNNSNPNWFKIKIINIGFSLFPL